VSDCGAGNLYDKYRNTHPVERRLVARFLRDARELAALSGASVAHEVGCGEGEISMMLAQTLGLRVRGSDQSAAVCEEASRRAHDRGLPISFTACPIEELNPPRDRAELIICCEVIEHLADPAAGVVNLARLADPWALLSVPREPLWRVLNLLRGAYVSAAGNTPGHVNHFGRQAFVDLLSARFQVVALRSPLPWTMVLARTR